MDIFSLKGKNVLITGAAGLLGQKHAEAIAFAGGRPILADIDATALGRVESAISTRAGCRALSVVMDVTSQASVENAKRSLLEKDVDVHVLINNAARNPAVSNDTVAHSNRLERLDLSAWERDVSVGLTGAVLCTGVFGEAMAARGSGVILNIASDLAVIAPDQRLYATPGAPEAEQNVKPVSYSVIKHGLIGLTKYVATYWAHRGVRCNALSPGGVFNGQSEEFVSRVRRLIPMDRMARVDEYQGAVIFLCSEASSYMNGANIVIDGGRSVW